MNTAREIRNIWDEIGRMKTRTAGSSSGAVKAFLGLNDTPAAYAGAALHLVRVNAGTNALEFVAAGVGDVVGPGASTDNALARFHLATGKIIQNSNAILNDAGLLLLAETANTKMTIGLTINQAANSNEILAFKQSNVAHGCTTYAETDTYYNTQIFIAATGGALISAFSQDYASCVIRGYFKTDNTTFATNWSAVIRLEAAKISAPGYGNCAAKQNVVAIRASRNATIESVWMANEAGQTWQTGTVWINDNSNVDMTTGITVQQGGADDEIVALKSTDVAHGCTARAETDTYYSIRKIAATEGGGYIRALGTGTRAYLLQGFFTTTTTGLSVASQAATSISAMKISGANYGNCAANQNAFAVLASRNATVENVWISTEAGQTWQPGSQWINEVSNANMTIGQTINQGANDDEIQAYKSSDVTHGCTTYAETDTFGSLAKINAANGGLMLNGFTVGAVGIGMRGFFGTDNTTKSVAGAGATQAIGYKISGAGITNSTADQNIFCVRTQRGGALETVVIIDEDGDIYYDGALQNYDDFDDALACRDAKQILSGRAKDFLKYNRKSLEEMGIVSAGGFISNKGMTALMLGAISQLHEENNFLKKQIAALAA